MVRNLSKSKLSNFAKKCTVAMITVSMLSLSLLPIGNANAETSANENTSDIIYISTVYGDLNNDHNIDALDYALMKNIILDNSAYKKAADLNGDKNINAIDLLIMKQFLYGCIDIFPVKDTLISTENGSIINVEQNKTFEISLEENGSTGYQWFYTISDNSALNLISEEYISCNNPLLDGAPIQKVWTFEALKPGTYTLTYEYLRPWETGKEPIKTVQCTINVN